MGMDTVPSSHLSRLRPELEQRKYIDYLDCLYCIPIGVTTVLERETPKLFGVIPSGPGCIRVDPVWWVWGGGTINHSTSTSGVSYQ